MEYRLFAEAKPGGAGPARWESNVPILATGLVLAGDTLYAAGAPDVLDETRPDIRSDAAEVVRATEEQEAALAGLRGGILMAVSKADGKEEARHDIDAPPVFDGMIAANGGLYMVLKDGSVQCWGRQ
ncbi:MAG: hypothetical protein ACYTKD_26975 [Planctomycetota bacterium]|jgi:hypothetical protein